MNASTRIIYGDSSARVRITLATAMLALPAAILLLPMLGNEHRRTDRGMSTDPIVAELIDAIMEVNVVETRRLLVRHAMDLNALDAWGVTPLAHALLASRLPGGESLVTLLVEHGADVNRADSRGYTPLMWSMSIKDDASVQQLVRLGADARACHPDGTSVLHVAVQYEVQPETVRQLLAAGADPTLRDDDGKRPVDYAREAGLTELAMMLDTHE